jgi:tetratricopeptide (TPR) repeat protein
MPSLIAAGSRAALVAISLVAIGCRSNAGSPGRKAEYAPPGACESCHQQVAKTYRSVTMARSLYRPSEANVIEDYAGENHLFHPASNRHYRMFRRDGKFFQRRYQLDPQGREVNAFEQEVAYIIGSGEHARSYLYRSASALIELPVTWYSRERRWGMSPGYDKPRHWDFTREIDAGCLFCHNAYPDQAAGAAHYGSPTRFPEQLPEGIDCQRCHGPGGRHAALAAGGKAKPGEIRSAIVNPQRLPPERLMDVCLQCHLETTSARLPGKLRRFGRTPYSFRPGESLSGYELEFDHPPAVGFDGKFEINSAGYRLRQSACFRASQGRLTCVTCHNPHQTLRGESAVAAYRAQCRGCHPQAHSGTVESDCASCHMPKRRAEDAVHVVMTDHRIHRWPPTGNLLTARREKDTPWRGDIVFLEHVRDLSSQEHDLYLGMALVMDQADRRRGIALLERNATAAPVEALVELATACLGEGDANKAVRYYRQALDKTAAMPKVRYNYARALELAGDTAQASVELQQVIAEAPDFPEAHNSFAALLLKQGQTESARQHFEKAIQVRPTQAEAYNNLGLLLASKGRLAEARQQLEQALSADPSFAEAHNTLAGLLSRDSEINGALRHLAEAIALDPTYAEARYNFARLLHAQGKVAQAVAEYRRVLELRPTLAEAHLSLGVALAESRQYAAAVAEFRETLRLHPNDGEARKNLELALELQAQGR